MKLRIVTSLLICLMLLASICVAQQQPEHKLVEFPMAFLRPTAKWELTKTKDGEAIIHEHQVTTLSMLRSGKAIIVSHFGDEQDRVVILVLRARSATEAKSWIVYDAAVKAGFYVVEMHPW